jgi:chemotaxis response regulator CheB
VKQGGGAVIAQKSFTANHDGMPSSAIRTGAVDYILPLEAIAPAVVAIAKGEPVRGRRDRPQFQSRR